MTKFYIAVSAIIFALVALAHIARVVQGWDVQVGANVIPMSVSWVGLAVTIVLGIWGGMLLRK